jgi:hypothetical protein
MKKFFTSRKYKKAYENLRRKLWQEMRIERHVNLGAELRGLSRGEYNRLKQEIFTIEGGWVNENMDFGNDLNHGFDDIY